MRLAFLSFEFWFVIPNMIFEVNLVALAVKHSQKFSKKRSKILCFLGCEKGFKNRML